VYVGTNSGLKVWDTATSAWATLSFSTKGTFSSLAVGGSYLYAATAYNSAIYSNGFTNVFYVSWNLDTDSVPAQSCNAGAISNAIAT
jgi:hypothetical protein